MTEDAVQRRGAAPAAAHVTEVPINVVARDVPESAVDYAVKRIGTPLDMVREPILFVRVKLAVAGDPGRERPASAQVTLDINGDLVRAHVAADTITEAVDLVAERLRRQLEDRAERRSAQRSTVRVPVPGEWRRGDLPTERPPYFDRAPDERQVVRHKTFAIDEQTPDEAAFDMDLLDYDFHLFRELTTGGEALLERRPGGRYRMTRVGPGPTDIGPNAIELEIAGDVPAIATLDEAVARLDHSGERFVFFRNADTLRGNVVYRRYDGHYGLITPE